MNNSKLAIDSVSFSERDEERQLYLAEEEAKTIKIIEAIHAVSESLAWSTLKTELFSAVPLSLKKDLLVEAKKDSPDVLKLNRLAGKLEWAEKYADLEKLENVYKTKLIGIRKNLHVTELTG